MGSGIAQLSEVLGSIDCNGENSKCLQPRPGMIIRISYASNWLPVICSRRSMAFICSASLAHTGSKVVIAPSRLKM